MGVQNVEQYSVPAFDSFERFLFEWLANVDVYTADYVFRPQHAFLMDSNGNRIVDFVGRMEELDQCISAVSMRLGRAIEIGHLNATNADLHYSDAYTSSEMVSIVERVYKRDVQAFSYRFSGLLPANDPPAPMAR
jgi:hypothetical protein